MQRILTYVLAMGCVGTSALLVQRDVSLHQTRSAEGQLANDAAFRDGLYLGKLARQRKTARPSPPVIGKDSVKNRHGGNKQHQFRPR